MTPATPAHVTSYEVEVGGDKGSPEFVGRARCSCGWSWSSGPRPAWDRAQSAARLAAASHRLVKVIDEL